MRTLTILFILFLFPIASVSQNQLQEDKEAVDTLFFSDKSKALELSEKNIPVAIASQDTNMSTYFLDQAGELNRMAGNYEKAIEQLQQCLLYKENWEDLKDLSLTHNNLGKTYLNRGEYALAVRHFLKALDLMEEDNNLIGQAFYLNNLAIVYDLQRNYNQALKYYERSLGIKRELEDEKGIAASLTNIGITYYNLGDYKKSLEYHQKANTIYSKFDDTTKIARTINNIGEAYIKIEDYVTAEEYLLKAYAYNDQIETVSLKFSIVNNLANVYSLIGQLKSAESFSEKAMKIATEANGFKYFREAYLVKADIAKQSNNFDEAYQYIRKSMAYNDSLINEANINAVAAMNAKYEYERNKRIISESKLDIAEKEKLIEQEKLKVFYWLAASIALFVLIVILFLMYWYKRKNSKLLKGQLVLIDKQKKNLEALNQRVKSELDKAKLTIEEKEELLNNVFTKSKEKELPPELLSLSKREMEVLSHLALGWSDDQLAERLHVSKSTIKTHLRRVYSKLLVRGRAEAVAIAHRYDLIGEDVEVVG